MSRSLTSLFSANINALCAKKSGLLAHLTKLHEALRDLTQDEAAAHHKVLKNATAPQLLSRELLKHSDKDVKTLVACCIVDIFRLLAPENPYNNEDTVTAFQAIIHQLHGLATFAPVNKILDSHVYYILNSLATVQSCVVPVLLGLEGVFGADDVAAAMFEAILTSLRADHPQQVLEHSVEILRLCLMESEGKNEELLDQLLLVLLPQNKADNSAAYQVAATTVCHVAKALEGPISAIFNHTLVGAARESMGCSTDVADNVYTLIFEVHRMAPALLNAVMPSLCLQLQTEDEDVRHRAVQLLGQLFASPHANYGAEFERCFQQFLGRGMDVSVKIRAEVVNACGLIAQFKLSLRKHLEGPLFARLRDPDEPLRLAALTRLIDIAHAEPSLLATETYTEMGEKVKDRRPEVRRLAMVGLARLYSRHVSSVVPPLSTAGADGTEALRGAINPEIWRLLSFIPGHLLQCWGFPELSTKHLTVHLLQEVLLPKVSAENGDDTTTSSSPPSESEEVKPAKKVTAQAAADIEDRRAAVLMLIYEHLAAEERPSLAAVLGFKARVRNELQTFLRITRATTATKKSNRTSDAVSVVSSEHEEKHSKALRKCMLRLHQLVPPVDKKMMHFEAIIAHKDRTVLKLLEHCVSPSDAVVQLVLHREDLKQRLTSKSPLGEYMGMVYDFACHVPSAGVVGQLLGYVDTHGVVADSVKCAELLGSLAKYAGSAFQDSAEELSGWLRACVTFDGARSRRELRGQLLVQCLAVLKDSSATLEADGALRLCSELVEYTKKTSEPAICEKLAELASCMAYHSVYDASASSSTAPSAVRSVKNLVNQLTSGKNLSRQNPRLDCDLAALSALCTIPQAAFVAMDFSRPSLTALTDQITAKSAAIVSFVRDELLASATTEDHVPAPTAARGLRTMTNAICAQAELAHLRRRTSTRGTSQASATTAQGLAQEVRDLTTLLFDCIRSSGGDLGGYIAEEAEEKECFFEAAADCALSMTRLHAFAATLTVDQWHMLGWTMLCPVDSIRTRLCNTLCMLIQLYPLSAKFLAYPCLFATDEVLYKRAENALAFAVQRRRRTHEEQCALAIGQGQSENQDRLNSLMPESILPYLLHLLSYHPDFPSSTAIENEEDKRRMKNLVRSVSMLLQVLQNSLINESCNMSYLLKLLNTANRYYVDRHDPQNVGLHFVVRLTVKLLHEQIKTSDNLQNHPGEVTLPHELYQRRVAGEDQGAENAAMVMLGAGSAAGLQQAESAIDKALQIAGRGNKPQRAGAVRAPAARAHRGGDEEVTAPRKRAADSPADELRRKSTSSAEKVTRAVARLPEEAPTRVVPRRGAKDAVSYREPVENDREMQQWEDAAAHAKKPRRSSELSTGRSSTGSAVAGAGAGSGRLSSSSARADGAGRTSGSGMTAWLERSQDASPAKMRQSVSPVLSRPRPSTSAALAPVVEEQASEPSGSGGSYDPLQEDTLMDIAAAPAVKKMAGKRSNTGVTGAFPVPPPAPAAAASAAGSSKGRALQPRTNTVAAPAAAEESGATGKTTGAKKAKVQEVEAETVEEDTRARETKTAKTTAARAQVAEVAAAVAPVRRSARPLRA